MGADERVDLTAHYDVCITIRRRRLVTAIRRLTSTHGLMNLPEFSAPRKTRGYRMRTMIAPSANLSVLIALVSVVFVVHADTAHAGATTPWWATTGPANAVAAPVSIDFWVANE
jgi:hypothetical protein